MPTREKFFREYQALKRRRTCFSPPEVHVRYGPTATNKSRFVFDKHGIDNPEIYKLPGSGFDGYCGQDIVLIEAFRSGSMNLPQLLDILDGYPTQVQVKGGTVDWSPKIIYICSTEHVDKWYRNLSRDRRDALHRRITSITCTASHEGPIC